MWKRQRTGSHSHPRRRYIFIALALVVWILLHATVAVSQSRDQSAAGRKIVTRVEPEYPETLKRLYIGGVVRVEAVVAPSGVVESAKLLGGSPILGQSAMKAVKQWKYVPAARKEKVVVQLEFDPHR